ncbi:MAG: uracil-DNA glycosylase family protein, partial [Dictyoglomus turgidum]
MTKDSNNGKPEYCIGCPLYSSTMVRSEYDPKVTPEVWIVGEAPGEQEVMKKRPFVGRAGQLLRRTLGMLNWEFHTLITNAVLCRPPKNRVPTLKEINHCRWHLNKIKEKFPTPGLIVCLGSTAAKALGIKHTKFDDIRGKLFTTPYGKVFVTMHPSRVLRSEHKLKHLFYLEMKKARSILEGSYNNELKKNVHVLSPQEAVKLLNSVPHDCYVAFDIETSLPQSDGSWPDWGLNPFHPKAGIYTAALAFSDHAYSFYVKEHKEVKHALREFLRKHPNLVTHNGKFETLFCKVLLGVVPRIKHDTMVLSYLLREEMQGYYSLSELTKVLLEGWEDYKNVKAVDILLYNGLDALATLKLFEVFSSELEHSVEGAHLKKAERFILDVILPTVVELQYNGFLISLDRIKESIREVELISELLGNKLAELTGVSNHRSKQFKNMFVDLCKRYLIDVSVTEKGEPSITKQFLDELIDGKQSIP